MQEREETYTIVRVAYEIKSANNFVSRPDTTTKERVRIVWRAGELNGPSHRMVLLAYASIDAIMAKVSFEC